MKSYVVNLLIAGLSVLIASYLSPGVTVDSFWYALLVAVVLALVNATIGTILKIIAFPLNLLSLGLIGMVINVMMVLLVDNIVTGFATSGFWTSALFALLLSVVQSFLSRHLLNKKNK